MSAGERPSAMGGRWKQERQRRDDQRDRAEDDENHERQPAGGRRFDVGLRRIMSEIADPHLLFDQPDAHEKKLHSENPRPNDIKGSTQGVPRYDSERTWTPPPCLDLPSGRSSETSYEAHSPSSASRSGSPR